MTAFRVVGMTTEPHAAKVRAALLALDPGAKLNALLARQILTAETRLSAEEVLKAVAHAGFIAVPQRRSSDRIDRTEVMRLAENSVIYAVCALYGGMLIGLILAMVHISMDSSCTTTLNGCRFTMAMFAVGFALLTAGVVFGFVLVRGTRATYRRIEAERYRRASGRRSLEQPAEDGTAGYVWVGRRPA